MAINFFVCPKILYKIDSRLTIKMTLNISYDGFITVKTMKSS